MFRTVESFAPSMKAWAKRRRKLENLRLVDNQRVKCVDNQRYFFFVILMRRSLTNPLTWQWTCWSLVFRMRYWGTPIMRCTRWVEHQLLGEFQNTNFAFKNVLHSVLFTRQNMLRRTNNDFVIRISNGVCSCLVYSKHAMCLCFRGALWTSSSSTCDSSWINCYRAPLPVYVDVEKLLCCLRCILCPCFFLEKAWSLAVTAQLTRFYIQTTEIPKRKLKEDKISLKILAFILLGAA